MLQKFLTYTGHHYGSDCGNANVVIGDEEAGVDRARDAHISPINQVCLEARPRGVRHVGTIELKNACS
jgi:hypothetical protein